MSTAIESLLSIKRWNEDEAKNLFAILLKELAIEEKRLSDLEDRYSCETRKLEANTDELVNIDEIRKRSEYLEHLLVRIHHQKKMIAEKERLVERGRLALTEASREKKIFEKLDSRQKALVDKEFQRKEQIRTDDHAVTGHHRKTGRS